MTPVFVDTSVFIAAENLAAGHLHSAALQWLDGLWRLRAGRTSSQVLIEFYQQVTQARPPLAQGDARAAIRRYQTWTPWPIDAATLETAWAIEARHPLVFGDCLALACAQHSGCAQLLTCALPAGLQIGPVQILSPLTPPGAALPDWPGN